MSKAEAILKRLNENGTLSRAIQEAVDDFRNGRSDEYENAQDFLAKLDKYGRDDVYENPRIF